jgi:hypothetical protein
MRGAFVMGVAVMLAAAGANAGHPSRDRAGRRPLCAKMDAQ